MSGSALATLFPKIVTFTAFSRNRSFAPPFLRPTAMSTFLTKIAHNNRVSLGKPRETQTLAEIITSEKRLIES